MKVVCCNPKCGKEYEAKFYSVEGISVPIMECPHCGLQHTVEINVLSSKPRKKEEIKKIDLGGSYYAVLGGSRILDITGTTDYSGSDDNPVTDWEKTNEFIVACNINSGGKDTVASAYRLYWQDNTDGGGYTAIAASGELNYTISDTSWNHGDALATANFVCDPVDPSHQTGEKTKNTGDTDSINLADDTDSELWFGVNSSSADRGNTYGFQLYSIAEAAIVGTLGVTVAMASTISASVSESANINDWPDAAESGDAYTGLFPVKRFTHSAGLGKQVYRIPEWYGTTPKGALITITGTDQSDGFDPWGLMSIGLVDGTSTLSYVVSWDADGFTGQASNYKHLCTDAVGMLPRSDTNSYWAHAVFCEFIQGGIVVDWQPIVSGYTGQVADITVQVTFFAGTNTQVKAIKANANEHVQSVGFEPKLVFSVSNGFPTNAVNHNGGSTCTMNIGIATNGEAGVVQNWIGIYGSNAVSTTHTYNYLGSGKLNAALLVSSLYEENSIGSFDSSGYTLTPDSVWNGTLIQLAVTFDDDVDSGYSTIPTSGNISITDAGLTPNHIGIILGNVTTLDTIQEGNNMLGIGLYSDYGDESSILMVAEDNITPDDVTSVSNSSIIHLEDNGQTVIADADFNQFTSSGFDLTVNTNPASATYFLWWAIGQTGSAEISESATINDTPSVIYTASVSESATINDAPVTLAIATVVTQDFNVPSSTGNSDFTIPGWSETPTAAIIRLYGYRYAPAYSGAPMEYSIGFTDGTSEYSIGLAAASGGTTDSGRTYNNSAIAKANQNGIGQAYTGAFVSFISGGIRLNFSGTLVSTDGLQITFFSGDNVQAHVGVYNPGNHVEDVGFESKLIYTASAGLASLGSTVSGRLSFGIASNGSNGLTQFWVGYGDLDNQATSTIGSYFGDGSVIGYVTNASLQWSSAISNIDSSGFNLSGATADDVLVLCLTFDEDVDAGVSTFPTTGDISITDPGFRPQSVEVILSTLTSVNTFDSTSSSQGFSSSVFDQLDGFSGSRSIGIHGEDGASNARNHSMSSSYIPYFDASWGLDIKGENETLTANGFDIDGFSYPATAVYFGWVAIEAKYEVIHRAIVAESATVNDAPNASSVYSASCSESCSINDSPQGYTAYDDSIAESASIDDAPDGSVVYYSAVAETVSINEIGEGQPTTSGGVGHGRFDLPEQAGTHSFQIPGWPQTPGAAQIVIVGTKNIDGYRDDAFFGIGFIDGVSEYSVSFFADNGETTTITASGSDNAAGNNAASTGGAPNVSIVFSQFRTGGVDLVLSGAGLSGNKYSICFTFFAGTGLQAKVGVASPGDHITDVGFPAKLILLTTIGAATVETAVEGGTINYGVTANGSAGLQKRVFSIFNKDNVGTTELTSHNHSAISILDLADNSINWSASVSDIDSDGFNLTSFSTDKVYYLALWFPPDVYCGTSSIPTSGDRVITAPGFTPQHVQIWGNTSIDQNVLNTTIQYVSYYLATTDETETHNASISSEDNVGTSDETSVHSTNLIHVETPGQTVLAESSAVAFTASGFNITMDVNPATAFFFGYFAIQEEVNFFEDSVNESASINEAQSTSDTFDDSVSESCTINDEPDGSAYKTGIGAESATVDDAPSALNVLTGAGSESATVDDAPTGVQVQAGAGSESASINDAPSVQGTFTDAGSESASINEAQTGEEVNEGATAETATVDDSPTVQANVSDATAESASVDDAPSAQVNYYAAGAESASVDDTPSALQVLIAAGAESASVDDSPDAAAAAGEETTESASIDDTPSAQVNYYATGAETASINEAQTGLETNEADGAETATVDDAPAVQAVLNATGAESATVDDTPSAARVLTASINESASIDDSPAGARIITGAIAESVSIDDTPAAQAALNAVGSEAMLVNEQQSSEEENDATIAESASIDDAPAAQVQLSDTGAESASVDDTPSALQVLTGAGAESASVDDSPAAQATLNDSISESLNINDVPTGVGEEEEETLETATVDDTPAVQAILNDAASESLSINDAPSTATEHAGTTAETLSINDTPAAALIQADTVDETATVNDTQSTQMAAAGAADESLSIGEAQTADETNSGTGLETATVDDAPTVQAILNDAVSESASVDDSPATQGIASDGTGESASVDDSPAAIKVMAAAVAESASVDDAPAAQAALNESGAESVSINDTPSASLTQYGYIDETLDVNETNYGYKGDEAETGESLTINDTCTAILVQYSSITETLAVEAATRALDLAYEKIEGYSIMTDAITAMSIMTDAINDKSLL